MASKKVQWTTSKEVAGLSTGLDFCANASEALYEYLTDNVTTAETGAGADLLTAINGVSPAAFSSYSRIHTPWTTPREGSDAGRFPCMYIWTEHIGEDWRETRNVYPRFRSRITIFAEHADMSTARKNAQLYGGWIAGLLHVMPFSQRTSYNWLAWYWNVPEPIDVTQSGVELTGDEDEAELYAHRIEFDWLHYELIAL